MDKDALSQLTIAPDVTVRTAIETIDRSKRKIALVVSIVTAPPSPATSPTWPTWASASTRSERRSAPACPRVCVGSGQLPLAPGATRPRRAARHRRAPAR